MFLNVKQNEIKKGIEEGYLGTAMHIRYFSERMAKQKCGHIVIVGSYQGVTVGLPTYSLEAANSYGLWALCESIRSEMGREGVLISYFVSLNNAEKHKSNYLVAQVDQMFPTSSPGEQAEALMDGIMNQ